MEENKPDSGLFGSLKNLAHKTGQISRKFWGNAVGMGEVVYYLENLTLPQRLCANLPDAEAALLQNIQENFTPTIAIKKQPTNRYKLSLTAELEESIGLVCCLANSLTLNHLVELIGKVHCLSHLLYHEQLIVVVIGLPDAENQLLVQELQKMLQTLSVSYCYVALSD